MANKALKNHLIAANAPVPQRAQADPRQVQNNAGGFTFEVSDKSRLERFLILGTDGGTYYVGEKKLTEDNAKFVVDLIKRNPELVLDTTVEISNEGRAYRNSQAIFVMALLYKHTSWVFKALLRQDFGKVVRTSTHLFEFAEYVELLGGWGRAKRRAVAEWYQSKSSDSLAYQAVKYRQRNGWTHRDLFRLSHPKEVDQNVGRFILGQETLGQNVPPIIGGFKAAQDSEHVTELIETLTIYPKLPWEAVPTQFHKSPDLWKKLVENGELQGQALLRQITRLSRLGMFKDLGFARVYANLLKDQEMIEKTRLHPIQYLLALVGHTEGQIDRNMRSSYFSVARNKDWTTSAIIADALDEGYNRAFKTITPADKRTMIALDVSGSMGSLAMGIDLSAMQVGAAMGMITARTEPMYDIRAFSHTMVPVDLSGRQRLDTVVSKLERIPMGGTDCALPMLTATKEKLEIDTFIVITDNETWAGRVHPHVALQQYRQASGIDAKLVVMGVTSTNFTIADPSDRGMLDMVGADSNAPRVVADFSAGRL